MQSVEQQTAEIYNSFISLTGRKGKLTMEEYLLLRNQAIKEIDSGLVSSDMAVFSSTVPDTAKKSSRECIQALPQTAPVTKSPLDRILHPDEPDMINTEEISYNNMPSDNNTQKEKEMSGFEILKNLPDKWN